MKRIQEDELLRPLFDKIGMRQAPDDLTLKIMDQIKAEPVMQPVRRSYFDLWWIGLGIVSVVSMYFTGVFGFIAGIFTPYFNEIYGLITGYASRLSVFLPSAEVALPSSYVLPVILPGILLILLMDAVFGRDLRRAA